MLKGKRPTEGPVEAFREQFRGVSAVRHELP